MIRCSKRSQRVRADSEWLKYINDAVQAGKAREGVQ